MSERADVMWFTLPSADAESSDGEMCATREEAVKQGLDYYGDGETFVVAKGHRVTESDVAQWCCNQIWSNLEFGEMENDLETGSEEPLLAPPASQFIENEFRDAIAAVIAKHNMLTPWYRWTECEEIKP